MKEFALITGAGHGLGRAFACELASRGISTLIVSSSNSIATLNQELIDRYGIESHCFTVDLTDYDALLRFTADINAHYAVFMLINNAGIGGTRRFASVDTHYLTNIIRLNITNTVLMTHQLLTNLLQQKQSYVLNVASMAALTPTAFKTVYPASKAFIDSFSRGLYQEYRKTNLMVSVVHPGAMATNEEVSQRIKKQKFFGRLTLVAPEKVARKSIDQLLKKKPIVMVNGFSYFFSRLIPTFVKIPILSKIVERELNEP